MKQEQDHYYILSHNDGGLPGTRWHDEKIYDYSDLLKEIENLEKLYEDEPNFLWRVDEITEKIFYRGCPTFLR